MSPVTTCVRYMKHCTKRVVTTEMHHVDGGVRSALSLTDMHYLVLQMSWKSDTNTAACHGQYVFDGLF